MRRIRNLVVLVVGSMIMVTGAANADEPTAAPDAATVVQGLHDELKAGYEAGDLTAVRGTVDGLDAVLAALSSDDAGLARTGAAALVVAADERNDLLAAHLAGIPDGEQRLLGLGPLDAVTGLVTSLLSTLLDLVMSLLGGLPVPLPPLPLPELPVPGLPELPVPAPPELPVPPPAAPLP
jgi:hypothetical protein